MLRIGLTGGIGSGKSLVAGIFIRLGIPVFFADAEAAAITASREVTEGLIKLFGPGIILADGKPDRKKMRELIFHDQDARVKVNRLIHPLVRKRFEDWCNMQDAPFILEEAAILFESGAYKNMDKVIAVTAPPELRISRVIKRDGVNEAHVKQIMATQMKEAEIIRLSDYVIVNDEVQPVLPRVLDIFNELSKTDHAHA